MPPIPINLDVPITPEKPQGVTPQTTNPSSNPPPTTTTTTAAPPPNSQSAYSPARPGAAAVPAPTPFAQPQPTRTIQQPQQNANGHGGPPAPQPGAVPLPPGQTQMQGQASNLPPPPKPGEAAKMREASVTTMPAQLSIPAPQQGYGATRSTTTTAGAMGGPQGPTTVNLGPVSSPAADSAGGYQQNIYAQELSSAQRASLEEQQRRESNFGGFGVGGAGGGTNGGMLGGAGGGNSSGLGGGGSGDEGMWGAVKGWASGVGSRLVETEEEVWRRINGGGGK